jgi:[NiFe] hydrogenase assembly HybE family chaperone
MNAAEHAASTGRLRARAHALAAAFEHVAVTRMAGLPMLNPALIVEALGFEIAESTDHDASVHAAGILITPWFMNLVWMPLEAQRHATEVGIKKTRPVGSHSFEFITGFDDVFGAFEACSLFSPMFEFADQAAARSTALAVLAALRLVTPQPVEPIPPRRVFLFGRGAQVPQASDASRPVLSPAQPREVAS